MPKEEAKRLSQEPMTVEGAQRVVLNYVRNDLLLMSPFEDKNFGELNSEERLERYGKIAEIFEGRNLPTEETKSLIMGIMVFEWRKRGRRELGEILRNEGLSGLGAMFSVESDDVFDELEELFPEGKGLLRKDFLEEVEFFRREGEYGSYEENWRLLPDLLLMDELGLSAEEKKIVAEGFLFDYFSRDPRQAWEVFYLAEGEEAKAALSLLMDRWGVDEVRRTELVQQLIDNTMRESEFNLTTETMVSCLEEVEGLVETDGLNWGELTEDKLIEVLANSRLELREMVSGKEQRETRADAAYRLARGWIDRQVYGGGENYVSLGDNFNNMEKKEFIQTVEEGMAEEVLNFVWKLRLEVEAESLRDRMLNELETDDLLKQKQADRQLKVTKEAEEELREAKKKVEKLEKEAQDRLSTALELLKN